MDPCSEAFLGHVQAGDAKAKSRSRSDGKSERVKMLEKTEISSRSRSDGESEGKTL
jgi:hypothetical protein